MTSNKPSDYELMANHKHASANKNFENDLKKLAPPPLTANGIEAYLKSFNAISHLWTYNQMSGTKITMDRVQIEKEAEYNYKFADASLDDIWWIIEIYERIVIGKQNNDSSTSQNRPSK